MKKVNILILALLILSSNLIGQSYDIDLRNFEQVNETEFTFEAYISNQSGVPYTLFSYQFHFEFDVAILNGTLLSDAVFTWEGESELSGVNRPEHTANAVPAVFNSTNNNRIQFFSPQWNSGTVPATYLDDNTEYKIDKFRIQLRDGADAHNFGDAAPNWRYRNGLAGIVVLRALDVSGNTTINGSNYATVTRNKPNAIDDHGLGVRQMAGYYFTGDGDWNEAARWNNITVANKNTLPGLNSNAIINGNVIIPNGLDVSLLPDLVKSGNGGEVTVLTGAEPLYSIELVPNGTGATVVLYDEIYNILPNPSTGIEAGTQFYFNTTGIPPSGSFINWTDQYSNVVATNQFAGPYTMPAEDMVITANWSSKSSNITVKSKSLLSSLTIVPGASLTVDKLFNDSSNGAEAIIVESDATGTGYLIHNNEGVLATIERYLSQTIYHYVSSPVVDAPYSLLQTENSPGTDDFWEWDEFEREWLNLNDPYNDPPVGILAPGKGYAVAYSLTEYTKAFEGEVNVGAVSFDATYTPGDEQPYWNQRGFNFVGNPYPAALNAELFLNANTSLYGLYFWDEDDNYIGNRDDYATWTTAGGVAGGKERHKPDGYIAPGQGFMAKVINSPVSAPANVTLGFEDDMRTVTPTYFYKASQDRDRIWLSVTGPQEDYNEILVAFMEGAEEGMDRTDAEKLKGNSNIAFYSMLEGGDFVIQGLPVLLQTDTYEIPLGLDAKITGHYTFNLEEIENFDPNTDITFEDRLTGEIIDLKTTPQYVVHIDVPGDDPVVVNDRFFLHFNGPTSVPVIDSKLTNVYAVNNQVYIRHNGSLEILDVEVINTLGQTVISTPVNATETIITVPGHNLVYIVKVRTNEGVESHKLLIR
jgi:hypothetical protein